MKEIFYDNKAREQVLAGAEKLYDAVKVTMGPKGRNVVIKKTGAAPIVSHDGVTVARAVEIPDPAESVGAELIREAANRSNDTVGDGTTTTTILTYHLLKQAHLLVAGGHNPMDLRKQLEEAARTVLAGLGDLVTAVADDEEKIQQVATISAGGDEVLGKMIAEVIIAIGPEGSVTVEPSQTMETSKQIVEGYKMQRGYFSPYFVNDHTRNEAVYGQPLFLLTSRKVDSVAELMPLLEKIAQSGAKELVIIAQDFEGEALATLILNHIKGVFHTLCIKSPGYGDSQLDYLNDIATLTGGTVIGEKSGMNFDDATLDDLGSAHRIISTKDTTTIVSGDGDKEQMQVRIDALRKQAAEAPSEVQQGGFEKRIADLTGKVAVIKVGGLTETEVEERKFRVDDAVAATRAAVAEGIVAGGGTILVDLASRLGDTTDQFGAKILQNALQEPFKQLMANAGLNAEKKLAELDSLNTGQGFNVLSPDSAVDLLEAGIVDPAKVTREAIQNAISVAGTAITMGALVIDVEEPAKA